ncbi:MAG: type II toxin-antitoxin system RelE/ParE family toxin [Caldilineales bacterium]|nr:type II toxin-antitoxin system RelE/ParE family toxin [Caldilineales bacterium]MDW8317735.1 type II toxin-antitoxin system RelE/ParE family toxin [Anaerolineae bacterium]
MPIRSYRDDGTRDIAENINSKAARRTLPLNLHQAARRRLAALDAMTSLNDLSPFPGWRLEQLKGDRAGQYSVRINDQYRICFEWDGIDALNVEITDYL